MSSVTFSASVGGNGSTVTDDSNASTGLANGGHITRFVPALAQVVAVAGVTVAAAATASATANATAWISGTTYALYTAVISPANQQTYRRLVAGGGTTDPATDTANWASISSARVDILTHAAASKTTPADTDELPIIDSAAAYFLKKLTWANLKAALWSSPAFTGSATFNGAGNMPGYKNMIVNGGFNVWQRGTTIANPGGVSADCWRGAGGIGETVSRIADQFYFFNIGHTP